MVILKYEYINTETYSTAFHFRFPYPSPLCVALFTNSLSLLFFGFRCECLSGLCGFPMCEAGSVPQIVSRGDGTPGKCGDVFECVNGT